MEGEESPNENHILVIPIPVQGHINPMLQFSKRLTSHKSNLKVTLITTLSISKTILAHQTASPINIEPISDDDSNQKNKSVETDLERFKIAILRILPNIIRERKDSNHPVKVIIYDSVIPEILDMAHTHGIHGVTFFTQSCAASAIYYHVHQGALKIPVEVPTVSLPCLPELRVSDLPSLIQDVAVYPSLLNWVLGKYSNLGKAKWILFNSFDELEDQVTKWMASKWPIKAIGPTIPSMYLDKRLNDDKNYGLDLFKPNVQACTTWLHSKPTGMVIYVSFGSLANLEEKQVEEIAWGLKNSNKYFLWVVRESEWHKLPINFIGTLETGLVVNWCSQLDVLAHPSIGCFVTHCGWNSIMEAVSLGIPMVAVPQWTDQPTNAKFIEDVWQVGIRVKADAKDNIVKREEIERCVREVMEGVRGKEMKSNVARWKELSKEAVDEGGSSDKNIEDFVEDLVRT